MSFIVRRTRRAPWIGESRDRDAAIREFARSEKDIDGLSVFEVTNDADRDLVVAAIACERQNTSRVDMIEVARETIERFVEIDATPEKGTTPLEAANRLHRSLDSDAAALRRLAEHLFDGGVTPREYTPAQVKQIVRKLVPDDVVGDEAKAFVQAERAKKKP